MVRKRPQLSKLANLDKATSRKMKGLFGAAPPAALLPEQYYAGGYYQPWAVPAYVASAAAPRAPFVYPAAPPWFPGCVPTSPLSAATSQPPGAPLGDPSGTTWPDLAHPGETNSRA
ncbi:hypothetical protein HPB50_000500 [Hyalomma asiaticum]|uniref:Uncharacterized protein n=1 Tax=Hyalomma asiaticum TaxID=266040 RepID=A0ACB7RPR9_HYAAI|nr:hypothetical protein HPB50_000500 [Hyalomma asiaticum]